MWDEVVEVGGEPGSKANSRRAVLLRGKLRFIKSKKALAYLQGFSSQVKIREPLLDGDLEAEVIIWFASRRPDLDGAVSLLLDAAQDVLFKNDRQVKVLHAYWALDRENPRARIRLRRLPEDSGLPS